MEFTDNPLEPTITDRGLAYMRPITTKEGATVEVHDSSNAERDELWFEFAPMVQPTLDGKYSIALDIPDAVTFAHQIIALARRRGYNPDGTRQAEATPEVVDGLVAELNTATAALNAALPHPADGTRSDTGAILELGSYLATVHTAAALAEDIPRRIADLDITAFTQDIGNHLTSAAEAAQRAIRDIALGDEAPRVFPPRPYHLNTAGDYLERLRVLALAVAARAGAVRVEIECYLDTDPDPDTVPEYARGLLNTTPNPECSCDDGNCDDCKRDRADTESE